ncbi:HSP20-like chaperone [Lenzites betulinus]|nr:HSP20-like chaperone [Lenzites betulinus]
MSLARHFFREMRPLFRMLEEPLGRPPTYLGGFPGSSRALFDDPFFNSSSLRPAVDVSEQGDRYIVEAELPGVKKENVNVRIGDGGRTLTIEGKVFSRSGEPQQSQATNDTASSSVVGTSGTSEGASEGKLASHSLWASKPNTDTSMAGSQALTTKEPESTALSTERIFSGTSTFTRTVVLPRPVDSSKVTAKLSDGVLTVTVPKAEDAGSVQVNVE